MVLNGMHVQLNYEAFGFGFGASSVMHLCHINRQQKTHQFE